MKYHKQLKREDLIKQGWDRMLLMIASEFSRAERLSKNGGGKEVEMCVLRAKELLGVLESDPSVPVNVGRSLFAILHQIMKPEKMRYGRLYNSFMALAS